MQLLAKGLPGGQTEGDSSTNSGRQDRRNGLYSPFAPEFRTVTVVTSVIKSPKKGWPNVLAFMQTGQGSPRFRLPTPLRNVRQCQTALIEGNTRPSLLYCGRPEASAVLR